MKLTYPVCFYPEEDGSYFVDIPDLGCSTQGKDMADAIYMASDAVGGLILDILKHGERIPTPSVVKTVKINPEYGDGFVSVVLIDLDAVEKNYSEKPVKKTLTIPSWLNEAAEKNNINFSAALKDALLHQLEQ